MVFYLFALKSLTKKNKRVFGRKVGNEASQSERSQRGISDL